MMLIAIEKSTDPEIPIVIGNRGTEGWWFCINAKPSNYSHNL